MTSDNRQREYITQRVLAASPMELVRILYETGAQAVARAIEAQHAGDIIERGRAISKTIEVLSELQASLRHDVSEEYSRTLAGLYSYMRSQMMRAHVEQSVPILQEVSRLLNTLLEGWTGAMANMESRDSEQGDAGTAEPVAVFSGSDPYSGDRSAECRSWQL